MRIFISFPPIESEKGIPLLSQNRQFQWFNEPTYIYPVIPAYAASLLKEKGHSVFWDDGIAEELDYQTWKKRLFKKRPDIIAMETKTPVVEKHWEMIDELKAEIKESQQKSKILKGASGDKNWNPKFVLMGDHITALPKETMENSQVDFVIQGGDFDFILLNIANYLNGKEKLKEGVWYRENEEIKNSGEYELNGHSLDELPMIDRKLTKWKLYAYKNGNFKHTPGSYMMSGRDCWWGKCTFCVTKEAQVLTMAGSKNIDQVEIGDKVLTHLGNYKKVKKVLRRNHNGGIINIRTHCLPPFKITPNHRILYASARKIARLKIDKKKKIRPSYKEAGQISKGDFLAIPINREIKQEKYLDIQRILEINPIVLETRKQISDNQIEKLLTLNKKGLSERKIALQLKLDRETIHRYKMLEKEGLPYQETNPLDNKREGIKFKGGKSLITKKVELTKDLFRLFGYYLAEGHVTKIKNRPNSFVLGFTFNKNETKYIKDVKKIILESFNIKPNIHFNNKSNTCQITVGNSLLAKLFKNIFGENCYVKKVPEFILKAEKSKQIELLKGLFRGDAHLRARKNRLEYILSTASGALASQVTSMFFRCGAIPSVRKTKLGKKMTCQQNIITLSSRDIVSLFKEEVEFTYSEDKFKNTRGFIAGDYVFLPITKMSKEKFNKTVYNLSVEKDHSYTVNFVGASNCSWTTLFPGEHFRTRSAEKALEEVGNLIDLGVKEIMEDSGTLPIGQWLEDFCQGMIEKGYNKKVVMSCNMRINGIKKPETWELMKKAGFRFILFGLESANQETLDKVRKNMKIEEIEPGLKMCKEAGLEPHITTMMGYPWETKAMAKQTIDLAKSLFKKGYVDTLQATIVIPYPGTPLYKYCKENNLLRFNDYSRFDQREQIMKSPLTTEDVQELVQGLYKSFITPKFILKKIISVRTMDDVKFIWRAGWKVIGHLTDFSSKKNK